MQFINDKGKLFGILNVLDLTILLFVALVIITLHIYAYSPPRILEHEEVLLQMYFPDVPHAIGQQIFVPGNEFIATYTKGDRMTIITVNYEYYGDYCLGDYNLSPLTCKYASFQHAFQDIPSRPEYEVDYFVTINASLEVDVEGDLLYNGFNMGEGNTVYLQLNNSYLRGVVWRTEYNHSVVAKFVTVSLSNQVYNPPAVEAIVYSFQGDAIGKIISIRKGKEEWYATLELEVDNYDGYYYLNERTLYVLDTITFVADDTIYTGEITAIS